MRLPARLALAALLACGCVGPQSEKRPAPDWAGRAWPEADALFTSDPRWLGGDGAYSISLDDKRTLWMFGDSFIARSLPGKRSDADWARNTAAIQTGRDPSKASIRFYWRTKSGKSVALFGPEGDRWLWPGHGALIQERLLLFFMRIRKTDEGGAFGFAAYGAEARLIENPREEPSAWRRATIELPKNDFGAILGTGGVISHKGHLYAYSPHHTTHRVYLARWSVEDAAKGVLDAPVWWDGRGWTSQNDLRGAPAAVVDKGQVESTVHFDRKREIFVLAQSVGFAPAHLALRTAPRPEGPWSPPKPVFRPEEAGFPSAFIYAGKAHPALSGAELVMTYASNTSDLGVLVNDMRLYFPRFVRAPAP